jgi:hypothetical protein
MALVFAPNVFVRGSRIPSRPGLDLRTAQANANIGRIVGPSGQSKYVVVYQRQATGSLRIIVDAASSDGPQQAPG